MALSDQTLSALQQLMAQDPELVAQVQTTDDQRKLAPSLPKRLQKAVLM